MPIVRIIPDFSREKSASSDSERPHSQIRREFGWLCGVSKILFTLKRMHKIVLRKIRDTLRIRQNPRRILSRNPFGANFASPVCGGQAKFGIKDYFKFKNIVFISLLIGISFFIYSNSLDGDFIIDDQGGILSKQKIHNAGVYFSKYFSLKMGVLWEVILVLLWQAGGSAFAYHLFGVIAHILCVVLLFVLCNAVFKDKKLAFLSSLIFAVHPIHTEAVSWISGGHYVLSSLFFIVSMVCYVKSDKSLHYLALSILFFIICFFSGHATATLPLMFITYDIFFREKNKETQKNIKFRILILSLALAVSFIFIAIYFINRNKFVHLIFYFRSWNYLIVVAKAFVYYLKILYLPLARGLYHPFAFNAIGIQKISPSFFFSIFIILSSIFFFFRYRRKFGVICFGIAWFYITYLPYSNIIPICNIISERYMYLPSVGICIILADLFLRVWEVINRNIQYRKVFRYLAVCAITLFLSSFSVLTMRRNFDYHNIITYWQSNINNFPDGYFVYNNLAGTFYAMGDLNAAAAYCYINLMNNQNQPHVWVNLGQIYEKKKNKDEAVKCYEESLAIDKNYFPAKIRLKSITESLDKN